MMQAGKRVSYISLNYQKSERHLESVRENNTTENDDIVKMISTTNEHSKDNDDSSVTSASTTTSMYKRKGGIFKKALKNDTPTKQEIIYQFRVLLDGNEKFIWLQAAAELNRLADTSAVCILCNTVKNTR